jgi:hypothetical protein
MKLKDDEKNTLEFGHALWHCLNSRIFRLRHLNTKDLYGAIRHLQGDYYLVQREWFEDKGRYQIVNQKYFRILTRGTIFCLVDDQEAKK